MIQIDPQVYFNRWNGVVGKVLYGEADIGITNIDFTSQRLVIVLK